MLKARRLPVLPLLLLLLLLLLLRQQCKCCLAKQPWALLLTLTAQAKIPQQSMPLIQSCIS
jgi:hypothetical protein